MNRKTNQFVVAPSVEVRSVSEVQGRLQKLGESNGGIGGCNGIYGGLAKDERVIVSRAGKERRTDFRLRRPLRMATITMLVTHSSKSF